MAALSSIFRTKGSNNAPDEKKAFLDPSVLTLYHSVAGRLKQLSKLPQRTNSNEWLATNTLAFFNHINVQVGAISALCTQHSCPSMTAGKETFEWLDDKKGKKTSKVNAQKFIDTSLTQIQNQLEDERIFPTKFGFDFPSDFVTIVKKTFRTYFAIIAHIYYHHFDVIKTLGLNDGLNTLFLHFIYFVHEFKLMEPKEWNCLEELYKVLVDVEKDMAKRPPVDDFEGMSLQGRNGGGRVEGQSSRPSKGGSASNPS